MFKKQKLLLNTQKSLTKASGTKTKKKNILKILFTFFYIIISTAESISTSSQNEEVFLLKLAEHLP